MGLNLEWLPDDLCVVRLPTHASLTPVLQLFTASTMSLASLVRTRDELSIVCTDTCWATVAELRDVAIVERGWRAFRVIGPLPFDTVGILSSITSPLAEAGISIFSQSSFDTDYVMVKGAVMRAAQAALKAAGHVWLELHTPELASPLGILEK